MDRPFASAFVALLGLLLSGCWLGGGGGIGSIELNCSNVRFLHASPDAPPMNVFYAGSSVSELGYADGTDFSCLLSQGQTRIQFEAILPGDDTIFIDEELTLDPNTDYTVIAVGNVDAPISTLVVANPGDIRTPAGIRAQVVHAAPLAPSVDAYLTAFDADLGASMPVNSAPLAYQDSTEVIGVTAGVYQIRVTLAGDPAAIIYDSGAIDLSDGMDLLFAAVQNTGPGSTPIQLVVLDGTVFDVVGDITSSVLPDVATPASVYAVHASPDAPNVDILADADATPVNDQIPLAVDLPFTGLCAIETVPAPADYILSVTATGDVTPVLSFPFAAEQAAETTAIVTGFLMSTPEIQPVLQAIDTRSVITETKFRVNHASPGTGVVDIYLLPDGTDINDPDVTANFPGVGFTASKGILSIAPGIYDIYVTPAGDKDVIAIEDQDFPLTGGQVVDVIIRDPQSDGSEGPLPQLIVVDYGTTPACTI